MSRLYLCTPRHNEILGKNVQAAFGSLERRQCTAWHGVSCDWGRFTCLAMQL